MRKGPPAPPRRGVDGILETLGGGARMGASRGAGREHPRRGEASQPLFVPELWLRTAVVRQGMACGELTHGRVSFVCVFFYNGDYWRFLQLERPPGREGAPRHSRTGCFSQRARGEGPSAGEGSAWPSEEGGAQHREKQGAGVRSRLGRGR